MFNPFAKKKPVVYQRKELDMYKPEYRRVIRHVVYHERATRVEVPEEPGNFTRLRIYIRGLLFLRLTLI
jgi:hypothetical protein